MCDADEVSFLKDQLRTEQERVLKLKSIVIKEKKSISTLNSNLERLSSQLNEVQQENLSLRGELEALRHNLTENGSFILCEEKQRSTEHELAAKVSQIHQKDLAFNELSGEMNRLTKQLAAEKEKQNMDHAVIEQLKQELLSARELVTNLEEQNKAFVSREYQLQTKFKKLREDRFYNLKKIKYPEGNSQENVKQLYENRKPCELRSQSTPELSATNINETVLGITNAVPEACVVDDLFSYHPTLNSLDMVRKCCEYLACLQPLFQQNSTIGLPVESYDQEMKLLLEYCSKYCHLNDSYTNKDTAACALQTMSDVNRNVSSLQVDREVQCTLLCSKDTCPSIQSTSGYHNHGMNHLREVSSPRSAESYDSAAALNLGDDVTRLQMLEVKVSDLEKYAAEQVDRAKLQMIDWSQKLELQAADYDHLIRDKETEISELRETCDHLSEEVSVYANFCSSIMLLIGKIDNPIDDKAIDWLGVADALNSSESQVSGYELTGLLDALYREINPRLQPNPDTQVTSNDESSNVDVLNFQNGSNYQLCEIKNQLNLTTKALAEAKKCASEAESTIAELKQELQNRDDKIQRMKQLLIRLKLDACGQQKANTNSEELDTEKQRLTDELESRIREVEELSSAKEQVESALLLAREEACQLRSTLDNLRDERDSMLRRFNQLNSEYNAYKVKALHALRSSHGTSATHSLASTTMNENLNEGPSSKVDSIANSAEFERLSNQLVKAQQSAEEASLRASLARAECDLAKEDLAEVRQKYSDLLKEFRDQREIWEAKLSSLSRDREQETSDRIKDLEELLATSQTQFDEQLRNEQARQQRMLCDERALWTAKLDRIVEENKLLQDELNYLRKNLSTCDDTGLTSRISGPSIQNPLLETSSFSPRYLRNRVQGDGADNVTDGFATPPGSHPNSEPDSLIDVRRKLSTPRPLILPLEQLLSSSHAIEPIASTVSSFGSPHPSRYQSGDLTHIDNFGSNPGIASSNSATSQLAGLRVALHNQQRRVEHLSELLNESEANVARLEEQAKVWPFICYDVGKSTNIVHQSLCHYS